MKKIILAFLACAMFVAFASAKTLKIYKSTSKITIDGDKSDWSGTWQKIDQNKASNTTSARSNATVGAKKANP